MSTPESAIAHKLWVDAQVAASEFGLEPEPGDLRYGEEPTGPSFTCREGEDGDEYEVLVVRRARRAERAGTLDLSMAAGSDKRLAQEVRAMEHLMAALRAIGRANAAVRGSDRLLAERELAGARAQMLAAETALRGEEAGRG